MFEEPLFQDNIMEHIIKYMSYYLGYENWFMIFCGVLLFLYLCYKFLMYHNNVSYKGDFPAEEYKFSLKDKKEIWAFVFLILCVIFNIFAIFSQEMSFFDSYDTGGQVLPLLETGVTPAWGAWGRFSPLAFWDTNILYAVTHHFWVMDIYLSIQSLIIVLLLNCFLKFISVWKRLVCIGLIMISPVVFSISSIIYAEKLLLMYIIGSLIFMQKYSEQPDKKCFLWFAILLINFALYSKELSVLFYFGILFYYSVNHISSGRLVPSSFFHPIKTARNYPFEALLFLSIAIFALLYKAIMYYFFTSTYISFRKMELLDLLQIYYTEMTVSIVVLFVFIKELFVKKKCIFMEGMALGTLFITAVLVFILKIGHPVFSMFYKSYYLIIPYIIGLIYILWHLKSRWIIALISCALFINSIVRDYVIYNHEDGSAYREIAEFVMSGNETSKVNVFISNHSENGDWYIFARRLPFAYYWPNADINFFFPNADLESIGWYKKRKVFYKEVPDSGDYFVIRKGIYYSQDIKEISSKESQKVFENKIFEVYLIK